MSDAHDHWFEPVADHLGGAYLRYSFTKGTEQEVDFLVERWGWSRGCGCSTSAAGPAATPTRWPGGGSRWSASTSASGSSTWRPGTRRRAPRSCGPTPGRCLRRRVRRRHLAVPGRLRAGRRPGRPLDGDGEVLDGMARALRPGGVAAVSAFSAYFQVRYLEDTDRFDADAGVNHERTEVADEAGAHDRGRPVDDVLHPAELRLLADRAGLAVRDLWSVTPGAYARRAPVDRDARVPPGGRAPGRLMVRLGPSPQVGPNERRRKSATRRSGRWEAAASLAVRARRARPCAIRRVLRGGVAT